MFDIKIGNTKNLLKLLQARVEIKYARDDAKVQDKLMYNIFGTKQIIKLSKILDSIGFFVSHTMMNN